MCDMKFLFVCFMPGLGILGNFSWHHGHHLVCYEVSTLVHQQSTVLPQCSSEKYRKTNLDHKSFQCIQATMDASTKLKRWPSYKNKSCQKDSTLQQTSGALPCIISDTDWHVSRTNLVL
jgi:hypothetical protein